MRSTATRRVFDRSGTARATRGGASRASAPFVRNVVEQLLAHPDGAGRIELHLDELERCDAAGVELLVHLERAAARAGRKLVVVHPSTLVRGALDGAGGLRIEMD
jgi:ABC-type transporter Mla MlaB component